MVVSQFENGMSVLSQNGLQTSIGMSLSGGIGGEQRIATLLANFTKLNYNGFIN